MHPEDQNQRPTQPPVQPSSHPPRSDGNPWDFLYSQPEPPKKKSFFQEYKKLILVASSAIVLLVVLGVAAALSPSSTTTESGEPSTTLEIPTTNVPLSTYDGQYFSVDYANSLKINIDESLGDPEGWFLHFAEDPDFVAYDIAIQAGDEAPAYENGSDGVEAFLAEQELAPPTNVYTAGAVVGGVDGLKTAGEYSDSDGVERVVLYATAQVNGKHIIVNGTYPKENRDITDSIDAMMASIRLK